MSDADDDDVVVKGEKIKNPLMSAFLKRGVPLTGEQQAARYTQQLLEKRDEATQLEEKKRSIAHLAAKNEAAVASASTSGALSSNNGDAKKKRRLAVPASVR